MWAEYRSLKAAGNCLLLCLNGCRCGRERLQLDILRDVLEDVTGFRCVEGDYLKQVVLWRCFERFAHDKLILLGFAFRDERRWWRRCGRRRGKLQFG